jgi:hypothetical protein
MLVMRTADGKGTCFVLVMIGPDPDATHGGKILRVRPSRLPFSLISFISCLLPYLISRLLCFALPLLLCSLFFVSLFVSLCPCFCFRVPLFFSFPCVGVTPPHSNVLLLPLIFLSPCPSNFFG